MSLDPILLSIPDTRSMQPLPSSIIRPASHAARLATSPMASSSRVSFTASRSRWREVKRSPLVRDMDTLPGQKAHIRGKKAKKRKSPAEAGRVEFMAQVSANNSQYCYCAGLYLQARWHGHPQNKVTRCGLRCSATTHRITRACVCESNR